MVKKGVALLVKWRGRLCILWAKGKGAYVLVVNVGSVTIMSLLILKVGSA
jgi:hypothetical protein